MAASTKNGRQGTLFFISETTRFSFVLKYFILPVIEILFHGHYSKKVQGIPSRNINKLCWRQLVIFFISKERWERICFFFVLFFFNLMLPSNSCYKHMMCCSKLTFKHRVYVLFGLFYSHKENPPFFSFQNRESQTCYFLLPIYILQFSDK